MPLVLCETALEVNDGFFYMSKNAQICFQTRPTFRELCKNMY